MRVTHNFPLFRLSSSCLHTPYDRGRWSGFAAHSTVCVCRSQCLLMQDRGIIYAAFQPSWANGQPFILAFFNYLWNWFTKFCGEPTSLSIGSWVNCNCIQWCSCWVLQCPWRWAAFNTSWVGMASSFGVSLELADILQLVSLLKKKPAGQ